MAPELPMHVDPYAVAKYPDATFQNDAEAQRLVTASMKRKEGHIKVLFFSMLAVFVASMLFGILGVPIAIVVGIGLMFVLLVPADFLLIYAPGLDCPHCSKKMKKGWAIIDENGRSGEFLICPTCRIYLYTHRTMR